MLTKVSASATLEQKIAAAINRFERAVREDEFSGGQPPEDRAYIAQEYREARAALVTLALEVPQSVATEPERIVRQGIFSAHYDGKSHWAAYLRDEILRDSRGNPKRCGSSHGALRAAMQPGALDQ